jgi:hypothetical protein
MNVVNNQVEISNQVVLEKYLQEKDCDTGENNRGIDKCLYTCLYCKYIYVYRNLFK